MIGIVCAFFHTEGKGFYSNGEYQEQTVSVTLGKKSEMKQADPQQGK